MENPNTWLVANLEKALEARGWRQADLARASGMTPTGIGAIVNGRSWPGPDTLARIAAALGVDPAALIRDPSGNTAVERSAKLRLLELVATLDESQAERLLPEAQIVASGFGASAAANAEELETDEGESGSG